MTTMDEANSQPPLSVTLASTLLDLEVEQTHKTIFQTGIRTLDKELPQNLWAGGHIYGLGSIEEGVLPSSSSSLSLGLEILATHLLSQSQSLDRRLNSIGAEAGQQQNIFIVAPPQQATASIQRLYGILRTRIEHSQAQAQAQSAARIYQAPQKPSPKVDPKTLLNYLSLLQYLDTSGLLESLSEISSLISSKDAPQISIVLIQGLSATIAALYRRSGLVQAAALFSSVLQALRNLGRASHGRCLILVELDVAWGSAYSSSAADPVKLASLPSAFSSSRGNVLRMNLGHNVLARLLEGGVDVVVVVHDADGRVDVRREKRRVVEVVKDERAGRSRSEKGAGRWCIWDG